jgi:hypothetical protein
MSAEMCKATVTHGYHDFACTRAAKPGEVLCATHLRVWRRWETEGRADSMACLWWHWPIKGAES